VTLSIRTPRADEAALVLGFVRQLADYEKLSHEVDATEDMIADALFGAQPRLWCDLAEWDGEAVGFSLWFLNFSSFCGRHGIYLEDIFVRPAFRGHGIGKALLASLARRCVENDWTRFEWSVPDWNAPSIAFYRSLGATLMQDWTICRVSGEALDNLASQARSAEVSS
jgi:GNAT superfamily N-acetyltransferase